MRYRVEVSERIARVYEVEAAPNQDSDEHNKLLCQGAALENERDGLAPPISGGLDGTVRLRVEPVHRHVNV